MSLMSAPPAYGVIVASFVDLVVGQPVVHLVEVVAVGGDATLQLRVADLELPVDPPGPEHRLVEHVRLVRREDVEDPVPRRWLRLHPEEPPEAIRQSSRLLQPVHLRQERLQRPHAAAPHASHDDALGLTSAERRGELEDGVATRVGDVSHPVARELVRPRRDRGAHRPAALRAHVAAVPQRVCLVDEDDHAPVASGQLAELPVQRLDLQDADTHEHVDEGAGLDEDEGLRGLARDRLRHQRLARARRSPEEQATRDVAAALLDRLGVLEEDDVLLHALQNGVLPLHVGEPSVDVVGHVHLGAAPRHEPEDPADLQDPERHDEEEVDDLAERLLDDPGEPEPRFQGVDLITRGADERGDDRPHDPGEHEESRQPAEPEPHVLVDTTERCFFSVERVPPEAVVTLRLFLEVVVELSEHLDPREREEPPALAHLILERTAERHVVRRHVGENEDEERAEQEDQQADPIPEVRGRSVFALGLLGSALELEAVFRLGIEIARHGEPSHPSIGGRCIRPSDVSDHYGTSAGQ